MPIIVALLFVLVPGNTAVAAPIPDGLCHLKLSDTHMPSVSVERGVAYHQDFFVDLRNCTVVASAITTSLITGPLPQSSALGTTRSTSETFDVTPGGLPDPNVFERQETWDTWPGGGWLETTYVEDRQTYSFDGANSYVSFLQTLAYTRNDGWYMTAGPSHWFNTPNPNSSVSTESYGAFNNTTFPCGCQPCDHQLWAEVRSYGDGSWTHSSSFTGDPGQTICSGYLRLHEDWGSW